MNATENRPAVVGQVEPSVRPHSGDWMSAHEAERLAALWCAGQPLDDLPQWRTAMQVLVRELADTRAALKKANDMAEHFERLWYLTNGAKQLGHSVEMFLRTYAKWLNGGQNALEMQRLEAALSSQQLPSNEAGR